MIQIQSLAELTLEEKAAIRRRHRGLVMATARECKVSHCLVSRVFSGHATSARVARALVARINGAPAAAELA